jgi:hypothetical protein
VIRSAPPEDDDDLIDEVAAFPPFTASAATSRDPRAYLLQPRCFPCPFRNKNTHSKWVCIYADYNDRWGGRRMVSASMLWEQFLCVITTSTSTSTSGTHSRSSALESLAAPIRCRFWSISCENALLLVSIGCEDMLIYVSVLQDIVFDVPKFNIDGLLRVTQSPSDVGTYYPAIQRCPDHTGNRVNLPIPIQQVKLHEYRHMCVENRIRRMNSHPNPDP